MGEILVSVGGDDAAKTLGTSGICCGDSEVLLPAVRLGTSKLAELDNDGLLEARGKGVEIAGLSPIVFTLILGIFDELNGGMGSWFCIFSEGY
jgi:hypothetical protein